MKKSHEHQPSKANWKRILALALALSMLIIPIKFPGAANAAEEGEGVLPNLVTDNFDDTRYTDGVTAQWEMWGTRAPVVADGVLHLDHSQYGEDPETGINTSYNNFALMTLKDAEGKDYAAEWSDYTFSVKHRRIAKTDTNGVSAGMTMRVYFRIQKMATDHHNNTMVGYVINMTGGLNSSGTLTLRKLYLDGTGANKDEELGRATVSCTPGTWYDLSVACEGNNIKVYYGGALIIDCTDNGSDLVAEPYLTGSVALGTQGRGGITEYDDFSITHLDNETVIADDFADNSYVDGVAYKWNAPASEAWDVEWAIEEQNANLSTITENGTLKLSADQYSYLAIMGTALNPSDPLKNEDATTMLTDYTFEMDVIRNMGDTDGRTIYPFYNMGPNPGTDAASYPWGGGAAVKLHRGSTYAGTFKIKTSNSRATFGAIGSHGGNATDVWRHLVIQVAGDQHTISMYNLADGKLVGQKTYTVNCNDSGFFGFQWEQKSTELEGACYEVDNLKITLANGKVAYEETFTLAEGQTEEEYMTAKKKVEDVYAVTSWENMGGVYAATSTAGATVSNVTVSDGSSAEWADYAIDADVLLSNAASTAGFVAHADGDKYYELRLAADAVSLYQVAGTAETLLATEAMTLDPNTWYLTKLEIDGDGSILKAYVDSSIVLEVEVPTGAYTKGTMGFKVNGKAKFDNLAVYPVELSDSRQFGTYTFAVSGTDALASDWDIGTVGTWKIANDQLVYENADASVVGISALKKKCILDNYNAEVSVTTPAAGEVGVIGRYDVDANSYYKLVMDLADGVVLSKVVAGVETVLDSVSVEELYLQGLLVKPETGYVLRLYMYEGLIQGFLNGVRMVEYKDDAAILKGVAGVAANNGGAITSLITTEAFAPSNLTLVDDKGNAVGTADAPIQVPLGNVPNLVYLFIKDDDGVNEADLIPVDTLEVSELDGTTLGAKTATIEYDDRIVPLYYTVIDRTADIEALVAEIEALNVSALTLENEAAVDALAAKYDDLTYMEKAKITDAVKEKLAAAEEAILFLQYPELAGTEIVFADDFDTTDANDKYNNDYNVTGQRDMGNWFVLNGEMYMYDTHNARNTTSFSTSNKLMNRDFSVKSISLDVQIIEDKAWAGIQFHFYDKEYYQFVITDKSNRIQLSGNQSQTIYANTEDGYMDDHIALDFEKGNWYNLKVTFDDGLIKCYVDDVLWITQQMEPTIYKDDVLSHGAIALNVSENWCKFDNLEVRGVENEWVDEVIVSTNTELPATEWTDDFQDETEGKDPSHWIEPWPEEQWTVKAEGENLYYGSIDHTADKSMTWLHVFETDVDVSAKLRVTALGDYPIAGLVTRLNAVNSYIKAGYDFTLQKWFIKVRYGEDFEEVVTYAADKSTVNVGQWYDVRLKAVDKAVELYVGDTLVVTADAGRKVMPGRIGVYTEYCDVDIDDFDAQLLSGQGAVQDGVVQFYAHDVIGYTGNLFQTLPLGDGRLLMNSGSNHYVSADGGKTWTKTTEFSDAGFAGGSTVRLHDGSILNVKNNDIVKKSTNGGLTWTQVGNIKPAWNEQNKYSQPGEHLSEVQLLDGTWRIFFTSGNQVGLDDGITGKRSVISEVFYSDDGGATWKRSENSPLHVSNLSYWCESHIIQIEKDVVDAMGNTIPKGTLIHYSSYNSADSMRYSLSFDGGVTWEGDYAMPEIPCGLMSMTIDEDPWNRGTYYMATVYSAPRAIQYGFPRARVALMKSTDGFNWEYLCDVDRWGDISDTDLEDLMQNVNMYIDISETKIYVQFGRSEAYGSSGSHQKQLGPVEIFDKSKLEVREWPQEYIIPAKSIVGIDVVPADEYIAGGELGGQIKVYYYDGTTELVDLSEAFVTAPDMSVAGEKRIIVDYKHFRDIFTVQVTEGAVPSEAPVISGVENGKTYCGDTEVTVSDADGDLASVTLNGTAVTLTDGKFTVSAAEGEQTIVAADEAGNVTTIKITVNAGHTGGTATCEDKAVCTVCGEAYGELAAHTGGTATCKDKAKCSVCGEAYGELNADNHAGEAKWTKTADKHSKAYECCGEIVIEEAAHTGGTATCEDKAECTVCGEAYGELAAHTGGTATCKDKAKCSVCGEAYGELNADNHAGEAKWTQTADKHSKAYECCGKVVVAEEAHELVDGKCECGYEAPASGGDNAGSGDNTQTGDNNQTGDNSALVLFGGLLAISALAAGVLLVPDIRKKLLGK